ncbi:MAG: DUF4157 domain-containing protein [Lachnospiraceae bacterium]|nr:DUF4157 domain-containing protein [Lachnospiraceae bacterium]
MIAKQNFVIMYYLCYHLQNQTAMRVYTKKPENQSRTLDSNPRASRQAPIADILQAYKNGTLGRQPVQRESVKDEELLQAKISGQTPASVILQRYKKSIQRYALEEEEEPLQGRFDTAQREKIDEDELLQGKFDSTSTTKQEPVQRKEKTNNTGLPDNLKTGIENLSGYSMDDVKVHYNSDKPSQLQALAYTQGTDIHVAPGQEKHLPHEAWHVIQQKQGRVQPTMQMQGVNVNDNQGLEQEADMMWQQAAQLKEIKNNYLSQLKFCPLVDKPIIQREHVEATCEINGKSETASSKQHYRSHWITDAMNKIAEVKPKLIPNGQDEWIEVAGNAKFQCAEPKSLSNVLLSNLNSKAQITETELSSIKWSNIVWKESPRDGTNAKPCPTCLTWLDGDFGKAHPREEAKQQVREIGAKSGKFFENKENLDQFNKKEIARQAWNEETGQYLEILKLISDTADVGGLGSFENYELLKSYKSFTKDIEDIEVELINLNTDYSSSTTSKEKSNIKSKIEIKEIELEKKRKERKAIELVIKTTIGIDE